MDTTFDGELYLRLEVERALLTQSVDRYTPWDSPVVETASALVAIHALDIDTARAVADDYALAASLRGGPGGHPGTGPRAPRGTSSVAPQRLTAPRVVACNRDVHQSWGRLRVHYVALGDRSTSVAFSAFESSPGALMQRVSLPGGVGLAQLSLTDDRGTSEPAHFSGGSGGSMATMQGQLATVNPLSRSTRWIGLPEGRVELGDEGDEHSSVRIETLPPLPAAERYLFQRVATNRHGFFPGPPVGVERTITTLVAAGALAPDDPVIDVVRAISGANMHGGATSTPGLPARWASMFARIGRSDGPTGAVAIGAVTPPVDGVVVGADALLSTPDGFDVRVATSPGTFFAPLPFEVDVDDSRVTWWAEDDLGNHYLGSSAGWGGDESLVEGTVHFQPPLDRRAVELRLLPTVKTQRAVITVRLPDWEAIA